MKQRDLWMGDRHYKDADTLPRPGREESFLRYKICDPFAGYYKLLLSQLP